MYTAIADVLEFHEAMKQPIGDPRNPDVSVDTQMRWDLIHEEFDELTLALQGKDKKGNTLSEEDKIIAVADALGDIAYVVAGAAVTWGIDLGGVFDRIHESNMTKVASDKREDGKILKGPNYRPPDIKRALADAKEVAETYGYGEDAFWPHPTVGPNSARISSALPQEDVEDSPKWLADMAKAAARPHKLKLAMKELSQTKGDFWSEPEANKSFGANEMPAEMSEKLLCDPEICSEDCPMCDEPRDTKPTPVHTYNWILLDRGACLFDCTCGRSHEVSTLAGTRGGRVKTAHKECICGSAYELTFGLLNGKETVDFTVTDLGEPGAKW